MGTRSLCLACRWDNRGSQKSFAGWHSLGYNAGRFPMITRRDFTKLASFAAGSMLVPSGGEAQGGQPSEVRNAAVTNGFVQSEGAEIYYECTGSGPAIVFAHGLGGESSFMVAAGSPFFRPLSVRYLWLSRIFSLRRDVPG